MKKIIDRRCSGTEDPMAHLPTGAEILLTDAKTDKHTPHIKV
jgi:hypothetical protein